MNLPLYKFDIGAVFKGVVGGSEAGIRNAIKLAETVAPCVLLIDEMEKLVAGLESSGKSDSGVTSRVIGTLLSWMQETKAPIYKLATCNTIRNLDSALFRRGRWDALFAVDLPTLEERKEILSIHLRKRGRDANNYDLNLLAKEMEGFVGAEIESVVDEALYIAFDADRELDTGDLKSVADELVPISKTDQDAISAFRDWMKSHAAPVSSSGSIKSRGSVGGDSPARKIRNLKVSDI
jgi:ATPases of the AAA+ class